MSAEVHQVPIVACVPSAIEPAERTAHFVLARKLFEVQPGTREALPNGLAFRLPSDSLNAVARFVANERKCCPFITFEITVEPGDGAVSLRMTGPDGTRAVLEAELDLQSPCGCK
jgi:hypothetical protein